MKALPLIVLVVIPSLCQAQEEDSVSLNWQRIIAALPADPIAASRVINGAYGSRGLPFTFWVADSLSDSAVAGLTQRMHPCGTVAFVHSPSLPPSDGRLEAERMIEVDSAGREIRRWYVPVDRWPVGVRGEALLVAIYAGGRQDLALEVRSNGTYQVVAFEGTRPPQVVECPPYRGFGESAYVRCARFDRRLVIYEGPCT